MRIAELAFAGVLGGACFFGLAILSVPKLHTLLDKLFNKPIVNPGSGNPPIKIRGGAMTFRATSWAKDASNGNNPCMVGDWTRIELDDVVPVNQPTTSQFSVVYPSASSWQMDLYSRTKNGMAQKNDGVRLLSTKNCGSPGTNGITLIPEPNSDLEYYPWQDADSGVTDEDQATKIKRFRDLDCVVTDVSKGDEDMCEHISNIYINIPPLKPGDDPSKKPVGAYLCLNGECVLGFGTPTNPTELRTASTSR